MRTTNYKKKFNNLLKDLEKQYPTYNIGRHISTAFADYGDIWGTSDKELCFALEKYITELELDTNEIVSDNYVDEIVEDGLNLFNEKTDDEI